MPRAHCLRLPDTHRRLLRLGLFAGSGVAEARPAASFVFQRARRPASMSAAFETLIESMRERTLTEMRSHPQVQSCKTLRGEDAAAFLRAYRSHLAGSGPVVQTHGAA